MSLRAIVVVVLIAGLLAAVLYLGDRFGLTGGAEDLQNREGPYPSEVFRERSR